MCTLAKETLFCPNQPSFFCYVLALCTWNASGIEVGNFKLEILPPTSTGSQHKSRAGRSVRLLFKASVFKSRSWRSPCPALC